MVRGKNKAGQRRAIKAKSKRVSYSPAGVSKLPRGPGVYTINDNGKKYVGSFDTPAGEIKNIYATENQEHLSAIQELLPDSRHMQLKETKLDDHVLHETRLSLIAVRVFGKRILDLVCNLIIN